MTAHSSARQQRPPVGYDAYGNMAVTSNSGFPLSGQTPSNTSQFSASNRLNGVGYDPAGNQLDLPSDCTNCLSYDAESRQASTG